MLTVANQTEVPIFRYKTTTLNTSIEQTSRQFIIPLAVADVKYIILETPFFEKFIQTINIQDFTLHFKYPKINRIPLIILLYFEKPTHTSRTSTESVLKHKYVQIQTPQILLTFP